jgi:hypothetical protein
MQTIENAPPTNWIPAYAGMTGFPKGISIPNDTSTGGGISLVAAGV